MNDAGDDRPPLVLAMQWVSHITSIAAEMVVPVLLGFWLDRQLGTVFVLALVGAAVGLIGGTCHLIRLTKPRDKQRPPDEPRDT